ncbi:uncharacterized protein LOC132755064 [Ruditapes philippinarum]|uniref:uncharacterized protein LOC132755064 n=1 Tax=Ruditapes philippinarum TaxID=129788 RepID=UPI00295ACA19|nr:uncharacterized protein LOC132755064 [Ruditapes philippinarum]
MWGTSHNRSNPWRLFRPSTATENHEPSRDRNNKTIEYSRARSSADTVLSKRQETNHVFYEQYDDNANANIIDKFNVYGWKKKFTCDKQTQTDPATETTTNQKIAARKSFANKVIYSKSCDSLLKKTPTRLYFSRSFDNSKKIRRCEIDEQQTTKFCDNRERVLEKLKKPHDDLSSNTAVFPEGLSMTDGFYGGNCYKNTQHEDEFMSPKEKCEKKPSEVPNRIEQRKSKQYLGDDICSDLESNLRNMSCQDKTEDTFINEWSPFHQNRERDNEFNDYRQSDDVSLASERSCYSISSEEQENEIEYEIVDWCEYNEGYKETEDCSKKRSGGISSQLNTPVLDLSALDGYHTAPNSPHAPIESEEYPPLYQEKEIILDFTENNGASNNKCVKEIKDFGNRCESDGASSHYKKEDNAFQKQTLCCKCGKTMASNEEQFQSGTVENRNKTNNRNNQYELVGQYQRSTEVDFRNLTLETPPFIAVNSLHYEADPETGKAKVVGRGSFGQVYKARFSDPRFNHLPIVIKEFDEEFTNSKEIIEEAKRLNYLQDTRYVPICYGLLCFGSPVQPKYGIVQEYVGTGLTLEQMLWDQYELPLEYWFRIAIQCCEGLARFHDKGILLNDIKTNNILLEFEDHSVRIRYIDFGLATDMRGKRYKNSRSLEDFVYLAPEVRKYGKITTVASDIYSLGFILEQIKKYTGVNELVVIARLCMERDPEKRLPPWKAAKLLKDHMIKLGFDVMFSWDV